MKSLYRYIVLLGCGCAFFQTGLLNHRIPVRTIKVVLTASAADDVIVIAVATVAAAVFFIAVPCVAGVSIASVVVATVTLLSLPLLLLPLQVSTLLILLLLPLMPSVQLPTDVIHCHCCCYLLLCC